MNRLIKFNIVKYGLLCILAMLTESKPLSAQQHIAFRGPKNTVVLADLTANTLTDLGGAFIGDPLVATIKGVPHVFVIGTTNTVYYRTPSTNWTLWGGNCSKLKTLRVANDQVTVEAYCPAAPSVWEKSSTVAWKQTAVPSATVSVGTQIPSPDKTWGVYTNSGGQALMFNFQTMKVTPLFGAFNQVPKLVIYRTEPYLFGVATDKVLYYRTLTQGWKSLGAVLSFDSAFTLSDGSDVELLANRSLTYIDRRTLLTDWQKFSVVDPRYAIGLNPSAQALLYDSQTHYVYNLFGQFKENPKLVIYRNEPYIFGVATDKVLYYRTLTQGWKSMGAASSLTSVSVINSGADVEVVVPGTSAATSRKRTLTSNAGTILLGDWKDVSTTTSGGSSTTSGGSTTVPTTPTTPTTPTVPTTPRQGNAKVAGPASSVDQYLMGFFDAWGDDIVKLRAAKTKAQFESILPTLNMTVLETKMMGLFQGSSLQSLMEKLIIAFARSKYSDGAGEIVKSSLEELGRNTATAGTLFAKALKNFPNDQMADQRAVLLDLLTRIPDIEPQVRALAKTSLKDSNLGVLPDAFSAEGKKIYVIMLAHAYLNTRPLPTEAKSVIADALKFTLDANQSADLKASLDNYLGYAEDYLNCDANGCKERGGRSESCSASNPCVLGLQCFQNKCVDFLGLGGRCGDAYPVCHPSLTCSGDEFSVIRTCVKPAQLGQSCKDRACDRDLSCFIREGICINIADIDEPCSGVSNPCRDSRVMACYQGYCRAKGSKVGDTCNDNLPCQDAFYCDGKSGAADRKCQAKKTAGQNCSRSEPCARGLGCQAAVGAVNGAGICGVRAKFGQPCDNLHTFCDMDAGLRCFTDNICRMPNNDSWSCKANSECKNFCIFGTCASKGGETARCEVDEHCKDGLVCNGSKQCALKGGKDTACPCRDGYACTAGVGGALSCQPLGQVDAPCATGSSPGCAPGLLCWQSAGAGSGRCKAEGTWGAPCSNGLESSVWPTCGKGFLCDSISKRCVGKTAPGGRCQSTNECADGSACSFSFGIGTCDSSCAWSGSEASDNKCNFNDMYACRKASGSFWGEVPTKCVKKLEFGASCVNDYNKDTAPCAPYLFCSQSLKSCQFRPIKGEACATDGSLPCVKGAICRVTPSGPRCQ